MDGGKYVVCWLRSVVEAGAEMNRGPWIMFLLAAVTPLMLCLVGCAAEPGRAPGLPVTQNYPDAPWRAKSLMPVSLRPVPGLEPLAVARRGVATIVIVPCSTMPYYREVADFLVRYLRQATGAKFSVAAQAPATGQAIYVGPVAVKGAESILARARSLPPEHFIVERFTGGVMLVGNDTYRALDLGRKLTIKRSPFLHGMQFCSKGTYFAAVDFLERFVGVRWYFLGPLGTCVPDWKQRDLVVPPMKYSDGPVFPYREACCIMLNAKAARACGYQVKPQLNKYYAQTEYLAWGNRNGNMSPGKLNHTDCYWGELYAREHPEYFALRKDGTRMTGQKGREMFSCQRCYSSEAGFQQHLRNIKEYLATGKGARAFTNRPGQCLPNRDFIYWAPNDGFRGCACADCQKLIDPDAPPNNRYARLIWTYTAKLGRAIKERWPGRKLCVFSAYSGAVDIPADIKLPDNIVFTFCLSGGTPDCYMKEPKYYQRNRELLELYFRTTGRKVYLWQYPNLPYYSTGILYPYMAPHAQAEFLRSSRDRVQGAFAHHTYAINSPDLYGRVLWNPDLDIDACLAEYPRKMYGKAGPLMKEYLDLRVSRWEKTRWSYLPPPVRIWKAIPDKLIWKETFPRHVRDRMEQLLASALKTVPVGSIEHRRIEYAIKVAAPFFEQGRFVDAMVKPVINCALASGPLVIDGELDEWRGVPCVRLRDWMGGPARERTELLVIHDRAAVYIAGRVYESTGAMLPAAAERAEKAGSIYRHDSVEIFLCPEQIGLDEAGMAQSEQFFQIALDANGSIEVRRKPLQSPESSVLRNFDCKLAVKPMGKGFRFELRIPFAAMGAPAPKAGCSEWFVNFYRNRPRGRDKGYQAWSPTLGKPFFDTRYFGILCFQDRPLFVFDWKSMKTAIKNAGSLRTSQAVKGGRYQAVFKETGKAGAGTGGNPWIDFYAPVLRLEQPVVVEYRFRYKGRGVSAINLCLKESREADGHRDYAVGKFIISPDTLGNTWSDWHLGRLKVSRTADRMRDITYWSVGLALKPGTDFMLEIDELRVYPAEAFKSSP